MFFLAFIFSLLAAGILTLGCLAYLRIKANFLKHKEMELTATVEMKADEVNLWRQERLHDAQMFLEDQNFAADVQAWFDSTYSTVGREKIVARLKGLKQDLYGVVALYDSQGVGRLAVPSPEKGIPWEMKGAAAEAISANKVVLTDLYRQAKTNKVYMSLAIPINLATKHKIIGAVVCQIDPDLFLYPALASWPIADKTSELVLISKKTSGNTLIYLNKLRLIGAPPLTIQKSLTEVQLPCVKAAIGQEGLIEATDCRGAQVLAAAKAIPDSPWFLLAKVDTSELYGPLHLWSKVILGLSLALIGVAGLSISLVWRNWDARYYQQQYRLESDKRTLLQRYEYMMKSANDMILVMDQDWKIIEANDRALTVYGYEPDELFNRQVWDLYADCQWAVITASLPEVEKRTGLRLEAVHRRQDGSTFPVEISSSVMEMENRSFHQYTVRDITERKRKEKAVEESKEQLRLLYAKLLTTEENERRRISKELHDELGQALMVLRFQVCAIEKKLPKNGKTLREECRQLLQELEGITEGVRRLARDLSPTVIEDVGLGAAIDSLLANFSGRYEVQYNPAQLEGLGELFCLPFQINIYRIFQEAMTNIAKHAHPAKIWVTVRKENGEVAFTIADDGKGFDAGEVMSSGVQDRGIGLAVMRERVQMMGGSLTISGQPGLGTKLSFTIPQEKEANHEPLQNHDCG
ncbi:MAG: PAS domain-containing sensor histidine kinase [Syntrophobacterales bacterium]|nr:PAS domain-containing sensor histidine kinase [Syntrophobacterales bacterium]